MHNYFGWEGNSGAERFLYETCSASECVLSLHLSRCVWEGRYHERTGGTREMLVQDICWRGSGAGTRAMLARELLKSLNLGRQVLRDKGYYERKSGTREKVARGKRWHERKGGTRSFLVPEKCGHQKLPDTRKMLILEEC